MLIVTSFPRSDIVNVVLETLTMDNCMHADDNAEPMAIGSSATLASRTISFLTLSELA